MWAPPNWNHVPKNVKSYHRECSVSYIYCQSILIDHCEKHDREVGGMDGSWSRPGILHIGNRSSCPIWLLCWHYLEMRWYAH